MEKRKLKFLLDYPTSNGVFTFERRMEIEKEDYEAFYYIVECYFYKEGKNSDFESLLNVKEDKMSHDEYMDFSKEKEKRIPEDLWEYFKRDDFVVTGVHFIEKEEDGTMVYEIEWEYEWVI